MSEHEKYEQVGRLAEEYSRAKGELSHLNEKLQSAFLVYQALGNQQGGASGVTYHEGQLVLQQRPYNSPPFVLNALMNYEQLLAAFEERQRLTQVVTDLTVRLRALAPHLI